MKAGEEQNRLALEWQRWPLKEAGNAGLGRVGLVGLLLLAVAVVLVLSLPPTTALVLTVLLILTVSPYFLPQQYRVSDQGVAVSRGFWANRREWKEFRAYRTTEQGFWLIPLDGGLDRSRFRAFFLPLPLDPTLHNRLAAGLARQLPPLTQTER